MIKVVAKRYLKSGALEEYTKIASELVDFTRNEKGCVDYGLYYHADDNMAVMMETWEDRESLDRHLGTIIPLGWPAKLNAFADPEKKGQVDTYELIY